MLETISSNPIFESSKLERLLFGEDDPIDVIPYLSFPPGYEFQPLFPSIGAAARFRVRKGGEWVSVYLDMKDHLGYMGKPYWEAYPIGGDAQRFLLHETDELAVAIVKEIDRRLEQHLPDAAAGSEGV